MNIKQKISFVKEILKDKEKTAKYKVFFKQSWSLTWPMLMILVFDFFMNMTDVYIAGVKGKEVQAGIGMANQSYYILTVVITAVTVGTIAVLSRIYGSIDREKDLPSGVFTAVVFAAICAATVTLLAILFAPMLLMRLNVDPAVQARAVTFIKVYCIGLFFHLMMVHFNGILRACKMMRISMKVMVFISILNIILNIILVFYTPVGEIGIPLSTAICWIIAFVITFPVIMRLMRPKAGVVRSFSRELAKRIFSISWPAGIVSFSWQLSSMMMFAIVGNLPEYSVETMAAMTAGLRIESMIYMPAFAFNMANAVLVGNLLGEKKPDDAFTAGLATAAIGVSLITVLTIVVVALAPHIAGLLASKDAMGNVDPIVFREIIVYLRVVMISEPFMAANLMFSGALNGAGDTRPLMRYTTFSLWVVRIPTAYIFGIVLGFGAVAVWWAMNVTFFSQSFLSGRRYLSKKWIK